MKSLILSHFDERMGPQIFLKAPEFLKDEELNQITLLMDLYDRGFFIHIFGGFRSANYIFEVTSPAARGNSEMLLISILMPEGELDLDLSKDLLERFVNEIQHVEDAYLAFHDSNSEKYQEIEDLFYAFYKSIPEETTVQKKKGTKLLVFGLRGSGKTPIIEKFKDLLSRRTLSNNNFDLSELFVDEISITKYEGSTQDKFSEFWTPHLKDQDALVYILDALDRDSYKEARDTLQKVAKMPGMEDIPLLIIFNKGHLSTEKIGDIHRELRIDALPQKDIKYFVTNEEEIDDEEINLAFSWLAKKISEKIVPNFNTNVGILFSLWNDPIGLEMLGLHPLDFFENLEEIAFRCLNVSKSIFGGKKFKKSFFVLPFIRMNMKATIFTDIIEDPLTPNGKYPVLLAIFYEDRIPSDIIIKYNEIIYEKLSKMKSYYSDGPKVEKDLIELHDIISEKLNNLSGSMRVLIKAEHRYQAIFDGSRDALILFDYKSGIITDANPKASELINYPLEDLIGLHPTEIIQEDSYNKIWNLLKKQLDSIDTLPVISELKMISGLTIPVELLGNKVHVGGQNLIQCSFRDITKRLQQEEIVKLSESKIKALLEAIPDMIIRMNIKGEILYFKPPAEFNKRQLNKLLPKNHISDLAERRQIEIIMDYASQTLKLQIMHTFKIRVSLIEKIISFETRMIPYGQNEVVLISKLL